MVKLSPTVVRKDDAVTADLARRGQIRWRDDAFQQQLARPDVPDVAQMLPVQMILAPEIPRSLFRDNGCAAFGKGVLEMRHAVPEHCGQKSAQGPAWTDREIPQ